jgi:hypothetical protein
VVVVYASQETCTRCRRSWRLRLTDPVSPRCKLGLVGYAMAEVKAGNYFHWCKIAHPI